MAITCTSRSTKMLPFPDRAPYWRASVDANAGDEPSVDGARFGWKADLGVRACELGLWAVDDGEELLAGEFLIQIIKHAFHRLVQALKPLGIALAIGLAQLRHQLADLRRERAIREVLESARPRPPFWSHDQLD